MFGLGKGVAIAFGLVLSGAFGTGILAEDAPTPEYVDANVDELVDCAADGGCGHAAIGLMVRWGLLGPRESNASDPELLGDAAPPDETPLEDPSGETPEGGPPMVPWDGFLQVTRGGVKLVRPLLFEHGGEYRFGGDDLIYPRNNRLTLEWRSSTTTHWDGVLALLVVPKMDNPMPHVTIHTDQWSHVFEARQLVGLHVRIPTDKMGHEIEINGFLVKRDPGLGKVAILKVFVRWGYLGTNESSAREAPDMDTTPAADGGNYTMVPWDGFISTTKGGVKLIRPVLFEHGGEYRFGGDDLIYPRNNRLTLEWRSSTTVHWDGVLVAVAVPIHAVPEAHVTIHTDQWSHVFEARQLVGLHVRIPTDNMGHEIEIGGKLVRILTPGERPVMSVDAEVFAADEDFVANDVAIRVRMGERPLADAEVYVNGELWGVTDVDGTVSAENLGAGLYTVAANYDRMTAATEFEVGE